MREGLRSRTLDAKQEKNDVDSGVNKDDGNTSVDDKVDDLEKDDVDSGLNKDVGITGVENDVGSEKDNVDSGQNKDDGVTSDGVTDKKRRGRRGGTHRREPDHVPCLRCDSTDTKFISYNNKKVSQPRYLCHACHRTWTRGGTIRKSKGWKRRRMESSANENGKVSSGLEKGDEIDKTDNENDKADLEKGDEVIKTEDYEKRVQVPDLNVECTEEDSLGSSVERKMEGKRNECEESDHMECNEEAHVNGYGDKHTEKPKIVRGQKGRKRKLVASSENSKVNSSLGKGDETNKTDDNEKQAQVPDLIDQECILDSSGSSVERKMEEKRNECEESQHMECNEEAHVNAHGDKHTEKPKIVRGQRGRKRKVVASYENSKVNSSLGKGDETNKTDDNEKQAQVPDLIDQECILDSLGSSMDRKMEEKRNGSEESEHMECNEESRVNVNGDNHTEKPETGRRPKAKKRKLVESSVCNGDDGMPRRKVKGAHFGGKAQVVGRILRSRTVVMSGGENTGDVALIGGVGGSRGKKEGDGSTKNVSKMEKAGRAQLIDRRKKKMKGRQGSPLKVHEKGGPLKVIGSEKQKEMGSRENGDQPRSKKVIMGSKFLDNGKQSRQAGHLNHAGEKTLAKRSKSNNHKEGGELGMRKSTKKQLLRDRLKAMLESAGWAIDYRPRNGKEYWDAVYVSPQGRGYWSVTLAYSVLKEQVESGNADSRALSAFTPIPEEDIRGLFRITKKKLGLEAGSKGQRKGAKKTDKGVAQKKSFKKKNPKSSNRRGKQKSSDSEQDVSANTLQRGMKKSNRDKRQNGRRFALLVRDSKKGLDPDSGGFALYDGKRSLLSWMIDLGTVPLSGKVQYRNNRRTRVLLEGRITRDGIHCDCCKETLALSDFESHSGSKLAQPFKNIYLESGSSLLQCLGDSWIKQNGSECIGFHSVDIHGGDPNDDTCNKCGDGGDLICCDGCPSTFHQNCLNIQNFPSGDWHCVYCSCKFCGMNGGNTCLGSQNCDTTGSTLLTCCLCEEKYHQLCVQVKDAVHVDSNCPSFCGKKCQEIFEQLQVLLGVKHQLEEGYSWTLIRRFDVSPDTSLSSVPEKVECNSKLAVAFSILDECFLPIVDQRSGINMIRNVVYSCGSNFSRVNYAGFLTAILEKGDEIISVASIRIHGNHLAEMPFIGTRYIYRRQGMCRRLLNAIELALCSLNIEKLVIPAISELLQTWTSVFGFMPLEQSNKKELKYMNMIVFPGVDMLQKPLLKQKFAGEDVNSTSATMSTEPNTEHQTTQEGATESDMGHSAGSDSNVPHDVALDNVHETNDVAAAAESVSQLPDISLNDASNTTSERPNFQESISLEKCLVQSGVTPDNQECKKKDIKDSQAPEGNALEVDGQHTVKDIIKQENAQSESTDVPPNDNSELKQQSLLWVEHKLSYVSQIASDATEFEVNPHAPDGKGKEGADCVQNGESNTVNHAFHTLDEGSVLFTGEITTQPQDADLVPGYEYSGQNVMHYDLKCETRLHSPNWRLDEKLRDPLFVVGNLPPTLSNHHPRSNSHEVLVNLDPLSDSKVDVANHCDACPDDCNPTSCLTVVPQNHEPEIVASVHNNCDPLVGALDGATKPNTRASRVSNGLCKSSECQSSVDENHTFVVNTSALNCPVGVTQTSCGATKNDIPDLNEEFNAAFANSCSDVDSLPNRPPMRANCSKESEPGSQVESNGVRKSGNLCRLM